MRRLTRNGHFGVTLVLLFLTLLHQRVSASDGPFGIEMGAPVNAYGCKPIEGALDANLCDKVPRVHPDIKLYAVTAGKEAGICHIRAVTEAIRNDPYGSTVRGVADAFYAQLTPKYGIAQKINHIKGSGLWRKESDWLMAILQNERTYSWVWENRAGRVLPGNIQAIQVSVAALGPSEALVHLDFQFTNWERCRAEISKAKGGAF